MGEKFFLDRNSWSLLSEFRWSQYPLAAPGILELVLSFPEHYWSLVHFTHQREDAGCWLLALEFEH